MRYLYTMISREKEVRYFGVYFQWRNTLYRTKGSKQTKESVDCFIFSLSIT